MKVLFTHGCDSCEVLIEHLSRCAHRPRYLIIVYLFVAAKGEVLVRHRRRRILLESSVGIKNDAGCQVCKIFYYVNIRHLHVCSSEKRGFPPENISPTAALCFVSFHVPINA